jgi:hypothetical protein
MASSTLFTLASPLNEGIPLLFALSDPFNKDNLFSEVNIPALSSQITSLPVTLLPQTAEDISPSSLFGPFSEDTHIRSASSSSNIPSLTQEEVTEHTIHDDDDIWPDADYSSPPSSMTHTWETFGAGRTGVSTQATPFITEQSPRVFDLTVQRHMNHVYAPREAGAVVDEKLFREVGSRVRNIDLVSFSIVTWS